LPTQSFWSIELTEAVANRDFINEELELISHQRGSFFIDV
jgi:hypothetical protein